MSKRKAPSEDDNNFNKDLSDFLNNVAKYELERTGNKNEFIRFTKAAQTVGAFKKRITSREEAEEVDGVDEKVADKIGEIFQTEKLMEEIKRKREEEISAIELLTRVLGIQPYKAKELFDSGIRSLDDLRNNKDRFPRRALIAVKYFEDFEKKIPRSEIELFEKKMREDVSLLDKDYLITICGSYRRGEPECDEVEVLLSHPNFISERTYQPELISHFLSPVVQKLISTSLIIETLIDGWMSFSGVFKLGTTARKVELKMIPHDQYYCTILHCTGSDSFNKKVIAHAREESLRLDELCLRPVGATGIFGEPLPISSEQDIFDYIDLPYKEPHERG